MKEHIFIFWQNLLSIHQSAFLSSLSQSHHVILIVEEALDRRRQNDGWEIPDFGKCKIMINPDDNKINSIFEIENAIHIFSGINAYTLTKQGLKLAIQKNVKIGIISEPFNWTGFKGKLRFVKYFFNRLRYDRHISFILAVGNRGRWCFEKTGFTKSKIFDWGYFTEKPNINVFMQKRQLPRIIFVGKLDNNKNIISLITICKHLQNHIEKLQIVGDGPLKQLVVQMIQNTSFEYLGILSNKEVQLMINQSDLLILPSIYKDGWGAVVNEALMCGVPVIASDHCGASALLNNKKRGVVFSVKKNNLQETISDFLKQLPCSLENRKEIKNWALSSISGEAIADYFEHICEYLFEKKEELPIAPWLKTQTS